jgi:hypothetical protein
VSTHHTPRLTKVKQFAQDIGVPYRAEERVREAEERAARAQKSARDAWAFVLALRRV